MKKNVYSKVLSNTEISHDIFKIVIERNEDFEEIQPGQFLHIKCGSEGGLLLRRPISISFYDNKRIGMVIRKAGKGTELLANSRTGQVLDVLGPLGNGFRIFDQHKNIMIVGGGIGIAPLLGLAQQAGDRKVTTLLGYKEQSFLADEFLKFGEVSISTEIGMEGHKGYVTDLVLGQIQEQQPDIIYACGPKPMLKSIQKISQEHGIPLQISVEEKMACGVGACLVCACKLRDSTDGYHYVKVCKDGPVFNGEEVIFSE